MIDCEFDTLILSLVLIWIFYVFNFNLQLSKVYIFSCSKKAFSLIYEAEYEIQLYFFDNQIYITDEIKLIYLSHNGNIIWIYWHFDSIDFIDFVEKNNYLCTLKRENNFKFKK